MPRVDLPGATIAITPDRTVKQAMITIVPVSERPSMASGGTDPAACLRTVWPGPVTALRLARRAIIGS
jgi:hypothetical protein